jgi:hypothetical protein
MFNESAKLIFIASVPLFLSLWAIVLLRDFSGNRQILHGWRSTVMLFLVFILMIGGIWVGFVEHPSWHNEAWRSWLLYLLSAVALVGYWKATKAKIAIHKSNKDASR